MRVDITRVALRHRNHQTLVETLHTPNWVERVIFRMKPKSEYFLGHKTVWFIFPAMKPITNKTDLKELAAIELKGMYIAERPTGRNMHEEKQKRDAARTERKKRN